MKKNLFATFVIILFISLSTTSCKINQELKNDNAEIEGVGGMKASPPRNFTPSELEIGRRICGNLKQKRLMFEGLPSDTEKFRFRGEVRNCFNNTANNSLFIASISNAGSSGVEYSSPGRAVNYFKDVTTDQNGIMKTLCDSLLVSDAVANTILDSNFKYSINLLINDGYDSYELIKSQKNSSGNYKSISSEKISLISNTKQASAKFIGVEKARIRYTRCEGDQFQTLSQTWIEAITPF